MLSKRVRMLAAKGDQNAIRTVLESYEDVLRKKATREGKVDPDLYESLVLNLIIHLPQVDI